MRAPFWLMVPTALAAAAACSKEPAPPAGRSRSAAADAAPVPAPAPDAEPAPAPDAGASDTEKALARIKTQYASDVHACYRKALEKNPTLRGRVDLTLTIGSDGKVTAADVTGFDAGVDTCIRELARTWSFDAPAAGGETVVKFPFYFERS